MSSAEEDLFAAEASIEVSSVEEDLFATEARVEVSSAEDDLFATEASVPSTDTFVFLFLGEGSLSPGRRGELDRLRCDRAGDRLSICERIPSSRGERAGRRPAEGARLGVGSLGASLLALALLPLALIWFFELFPAGQCGRVQWNSGRPELSVNKVSAVKQS